MTKTIIIILIIIQSLVLGYYIFPVDLIKRTVWDIDWNIFDGRLSNSRHNEPSLNDLILLDEDISKINFDYKWLENNQSRIISIAHRGGNHFITGMNTKKTIDNSIKNGFRFIEVDLIIDKSGNIVCLNEAVELGQLCNLDWLIELAIEHTDVFIIIDYKGDVHNMSEFNDFYKIILEHKNFNEVSGNFIPQIYNFRNIKLFKNKTKFSGPIFTSYQSTMPASLVVQLSKKYGIKVITFPVTRHKEFVKIFTNGIVYFTHPVEDFREAIRLFNLNIGGIYTSNINFSVKN
jgi:hypothetical protein